MMDTESIKRPAGEIDGWLTPREGNLLQRLARECSGRGVIVEIGSWKSKSTIRLAAGSMEGAAAAVYAIDPHTGAGPQIEREGEVWTFDEFTRNIERAGVGGVVKPIVKTSEEAARDYREIVILTDWDRAGEELARKLELHLQGTGARVDAETRERLKRMVRREIKDVESLSRFVERVRAERCPKELP